MFFVRDVKRGKGIAALSRERTDVSRGGGRRWWMEEDGSHSAIFIERPSQQEILQTAWRKNLLQLRIYRVFPKRLFSYWRTPYTPNQRSKVSVAETVVCTWNDAFWMRVLCFNKPLTAIRRSRIVNCGSVHRFADCRGLSSSSFAPLLVYRLANNRVGTEKYEIQ